MDDTHGTFSSGVDTVIYQYLGSAWRFASKEDPVAGRKLRAALNLTFCIYTKSRDTEIRKLLDTLGSCLHA